MVKEVHSVKSMREKFKSIQPSDTTGDFSRIPKKMTRTELLENRRKEAIPDLSYDLDGDGYVGGRDYVVARRFDKDLKNYLTNEEKSSAL